MSSLTTVAALYVDTKGPYMDMPGVDAWTEARDARRYTGAHPVVAHPPCADWSRLRGLAKHVEGRRELAPFAVWQVRACGGVLEHPAWSELWPELDLPRPGCLPDAWGGWSIEVNQVSWGHPAVKPTWLYFVGVQRAAVVPRRGGTPTHVVSTVRRDTPMLRCSALKRRLTPPAFASWLIDLARGATGARP
jgi:hypothetical protein